MLTAVVLQPNAAWYSYGRTAVRPYVHPYVRTYGTYSEHDVIDVLSINNRNPHTQYLRYYPFRVFRGYYRSSIPVDLLYSEITRYSESIQNYIHEYILYLGTYKYLKNLELYEWPSCNFVIQSTNPLESTIHKLFSTIYA
eukprot:SAG31_NODE_1950_length_6833_cov_2.560885_1_plen_140_part_00